MNPLSRLQAWRKTSLRRNRQARQAQQARKSALLPRLLLRRPLLRRPLLRRPLLRRLGVDVALLGVAALLPLATLVWNDENEQQQLARLPQEQATYVEGWQMAGTRSRVFLKTPSPDAREATSQEPSQEWTIRCGRLYKIVSSRLPPFRQEGLSSPQTRLQCVEGAQVATGALSLSTESLVYEVGAQGARVSTERPLFLQEEEKRFSAQGGGGIEEHGDFRLFREVLLQAPRLQISAQGEAYSKGFSDKGFLGKKERRAIVFKREVDFSFQTSLNRYHGKAQQATLHPCSESSKRDCRVFGNSAIRRIVLTDSVVVSKSGRGVSEVWTLQAERVVVEGNQARYDGGKSGGKSGGKNDGKSGGFLGAARIVLEDGTELMGERGSHDFSDDSGMLCGGAKVSSEKGVLTAACLRYNLTEQRYSLESSTNARAISEQFFTY